VQLRRRAVRCRLWLADFVGKEGSVFVAGEVRLGVLNGAFDSRSSGDGRVTSKISFVELEHSSILDSGGIEGERGVWWGD